MGEVGGRMERSNPVPSLLFSAGYEVRWFIDFERNVGNYWIRKTIPEDFDVYSFDCFAIKIKVILTEHNNMIYNIVRVSTDVFCLKMFSDLIYYNK